MRIQITMFLKVFHSALPYRKYLASPVADLLGSSVEFDCFLIAASLLLCN